MNNLIQYRLTDKPRFFFLIGDKALEIVNPEVLPNLYKDVADVWYTTNWNNWDNPIHNLKHNDTFSLPDGVEFKEELICNKMSCAHSEGCYAEGLSFETCAAKKFIRLSKKKEPEPDGQSNCGGYSEEVNKKPDTKTAEEIVNAVLVDGNLVYSTGKQRDAIIEAMHEYASPLKKRIEELEFEVKGLLGLIEPNHGKQ